MTQTNPPSKVPTFIQRLGQLIPPPVAALPLSAGWRVAEWLQALPIPTDLHGRIFEITIKDLGLSMRFTCQGSHLQPSWRGEPQLKLAASLSDFMRMAAGDIDADTVIQAEATLRRRILRAFVGRGLLENFEAKEMLGYKHSGFSVDAGVCIESHDRPGLERLLRYCARPPFAMDRLRKEGSKLVYRCGKQRSEPTSDKRGAKVDELHLTPLELIDRIAALVPPPRTHRHRYFGVLAPNSPLRAAVTALATPAQAAPVLGASISTGECAPGVVPMSSALPSQSEPVLPKRAAHYLWAVLIARIYEVFPLLCPLCGGHMRIIAFITHSADIRHILDHIGADSEPPRISPARGPPLWDDCSDAQMDDGAQTEPADWDLAAQPAPDFEVDQRICHFSA